MPALFKLILLLAVTLLTRLGAGAAVPELDDTAQETDCIPGTIKNRGFGNGHLAPWYFKVNPPPNAATATAQVVNDTGAEGTSRSLLLNTYSAVGMGKPEYQSVYSSLYQYFKGCANTTYELTFWLKQLKTTYSRDFYPELHVYLRSPSGGRFDVGGVDCYFHKKNVTCSQGGPIEVTDVTFSVGEWGMVKFNATLAIGGAWRTFLYTQLASNQTDPVQTDLRVLVDQFSLTPISS